MNFRMNVRKQKGVALVIGLVMLLVLTIMGISSMSNTTTELKIACNFQTHNDAFQGAMSCVEDALSQTSLGATYPFDVTCEVPGSNSKVVATIDELGCEQVTGSSLQVAAYRNIYAIDTQSAAQGCGGEARSHIVQAVGLRTPQDCTNK